MNIGEFQLDSPLMNAGGLVKTFEDTQRMALTSVGAVVAGSFTLNEKVGNSPNGEVVYYHDPETRITYNSLGMPNKGLIELAASGELRRMIDVTHDADKPFILNFAPITDDPLEEVISMSEVLANAKIEDLDGFELNASCPNVVLEDGGRHELLSHHPQQLGEILLELSDISVNEVPIGLVVVRISPFRQESDAVELAIVLERSTTRAVSAFNTFPGAIPTNKNGEQILKVPQGMGGQSGLGMSSRADEQTEWLVDARNLINGTFEIIGSNGVGNAETIRKRINIGASAVSATTLFWESQSWGEAASRVLREYSELTDV